MKLSDLPSTALTLVFIAVVIVAGFLVIDGITVDSACQTGYTYNASSTLCVEDANASHVDQPRTFAGNSSIKIQSGMDNITDYASTWGTIIGVAVLLAIVIGGFSFGRKKGYF